jgi:hypothetical protein
MQLSNNVFKFECPFSLSNVHHPFLKSERRFILMIKSAKGIEINKKIICYTYLHIWFKHVFGILNYKIWWYALQKLFIFIWRRAWINFMEEKILLKYFISLISIRLFWKMHKLCLISNFYMFKYDFMWLSFSK